MDRRRVIKLSGGGVAALAATPVIAPPAMQPAVNLHGPYLDLMTPHGALLAKARMEGNLDESREKFGSGVGTVSAVLPNQAIRQIFGFQLYSASRLRKQADGSYFLLHRETILYTDLATGEILDSTINPLTGERVKVVHVVNDPFNEHFQAYYHPFSHSSFGGKLPEKVPLTIDWRVLPGGIASVQDQYNLYYPATLQPDKWPRASAGPMNRVTEVFTKYPSLADLQNPQLTSVEYHGEWTRVTPWLPWMLMGQVPGHIMYNAVYAVHDRMEAQSPAVLPYLARHYPKMLHAPMQWSGKNESSLENYAETQKPFAKKGH